MSKETMQWLNQNTLVGFTDKRGKAWHYRENEQGEQANHYAGAIPVEDVHSRLFDWDAVSAAPWFQMPDGTMVQDESRQYIVRSDTRAPLGVFGLGYTPHPYKEWLVRNVETILDDDLQIGSAGLLKGGGVAWVQVEMSESVKAAGVEFRPFLTASTSFDGSLASTYLTGAQVVVCDNTLSVALGSASSVIKVKHSRNSIGKIADVREALGIVHSAADDFIAQIEALTAREVSDKEWKAFVEAYTMPGNADTKAGATIAERRQGELAYLWNADERVSPWAGTAFGVIQAVNTHTHHVATVRGKHRAERNMEHMVRGQWDALDKGTLALLDKVQSR
jgi:phage/plasmid-like protein (TIGR03299 family)